MDKDKHTDLEQEHLEKEEVILNDYYAQQAMPTIDVAEELSRFKEKHFNSGSHSIRPYVVAVISMAAIALLVFTLFKNFGSTPHPVAPHNDNTIVAYQAKETGKQDVVIQASNGTTHTIKQGKVTMKPSTDGVATTMHTLTTPARRTAEVELADGSIVWLNANSKLTFPDKFTGKERKVTIEGEAYFKVTHHADHPFVVSTGKMNTVVLGTEFDVNTNYHNSQCVTLVKGSVEVSDVQGKSSRKIIPGENATLLPNASFAVKSVDTNLYCAWKDGNFYFDNSTLWDIAQELGRWYNVSVVFNNPRRISTRIFLNASRHASVEEILDVLNSLNKAKFTLRNRQIIIN